MRAAKMSKIQSLRNLFTISSGNQLSKAQLRATTTSDDSIAYVSRTHRRNGLNGWTASIPGITPFPAGSITVCLRSRNHALASFIQPIPFYTSYHVAVLTPKRDMTLVEKIWWCKCIEANRFRYNFGRQANRTLGSLAVPAAVPDFVSTLKAPDFSKKQVVRKNLGTQEWAKIKLADLFSLHSGRRDVRRDMPAGDTPWVSSSAENNGISAYVKAEPDFSAGCITVASNGSIGASFYQPDPFIASTDVTVLQPKFDMSPLCGIFLCAVISHEAWKYNFARKWSTDRMQATELRLPLTSKGMLNTKRIEELVSSSKYSFLIKSK